MTDFHRPGGPPSRPPGTPRSPAQRQPGTTRPRGDARAPQRRPEPRPARLWPRLAWSAAAVAIVAAGVAVFVAVAFPGDLVRDRIVAEVKARTGRDLTIAGPVTFSTIPSPTVSLSDVALSAPPEMQAPPVVSIKTLQVSVALMPLLWREVVIDRIVLQEPVFELTVDANGRKSWNLNRKTAAVAPVRLAQAAPPVNETAPPAAETAPPAAETATDAAPVQAPARPRSSSLPDISLRDVTIENGSVRFADARSGINREATALQAKFAVKSLQHPADANGSFQFRGETVDFNIELGAVEPILTNAPARVALKLASQPLNAAYEGTILFGGNEADGALTAKAPSTARAAAWFGAALPRDVNLGSFDVAGQFRLSGKVYAVSHATLNVNGMQASGHVSLDTAPARPMLHGSLETAELDVNRLTAPPAAPEPDAPAEPRSLTPIRTGDPSLGDQPDGAAAAPGPRVKGYASRGGWSEQPIRLAALNAVDADVKIDVGSLLYKELKVGRSRLAVGLKDAVLTATSDELNLYGGKGRGSVVLDGRAPDQARVAIDLTFDGVALRPLLRDAAQLQWIEGNGHVSLAVAGAGANQRALIETLAGKAQLNVAKGAIVGIDINKMAQSLSEGKFKNLTTEPEDRTVFTGLTGNWTVKDGLARNDDLRVSSDLVVVSGNGTVALPDRTLDYTIRPKLAGAGGNDGKGLSGIEVPVHVSGSWEKPKYKADVGGAVGEIGRRLKGKSAGEIVDELVGKDSKGESKAKKLLDKLFR